MSNRPNPVALTAAMLARRPIAGPTAAGLTTELGIACLASELHRLAPAVAMCNGEWEDSQRSKLYAYREGSNRSDQIYGAERLKALEKSIKDYGTRLDKKIAKLNAKLAPLALQCSRHGDPRGCVFKLTSTDPARPVGYDNEWPVA